MDHAKTVWCGNLSPQVTEELLYELFLQVGPLERVTIPTDKEGRKSNFGFVTFKHEDSVEYAVKLFENTKLYGQNVLIKPRNVGNPQNKRLDRNASREERQNSQMSPIETLHMCSMNPSYNINDRLGYNFDHNRKRDREDRYRDNHISHRRLDFHERRKSPDRRRHFNERRGRNFSGNRRNNHY